MNKVISKENSFDLNLKWHFPEGKKYAFTFIALFIALIIIYGNSFHSQFHFDDIPNIVNNPNAHLTSLSWENIKKTSYVTGYGQSKLTRPLTRFTFALNYLIDGTNVFGYHIVNFAIHYLAAIFLFLFIYNTLQLPLLNERYGKTAYSIALLSVFFWATHPIQVTSVTYIVQRMTSMAGMFYIMAMYFYLKGRMADGAGKKVGHFALCGIASIFSFASKENAAMLPVSIFLYDLFLIQGLTNENLKKNLKIVVLPFLILLLIGNFYVDLPSIFDGYKLRPFTLFERLLTEPRVIIFYVSLLLYPISSRLTFLHDFEISSSFFSPWTTLPAIFLIFLSIIIAIKISRKRPLIAYCILFFFMNHLIEGSIIPLELIFEHTNYLPSMLFIVPLSILALMSLDYFSYRKSIQSIMSFVLIFLLAAQGHTTYIRNSIFKNGITLWSDNIKKAPDLQRPYQGLGVALLSDGYYDDGLSELQKALNAKSAGNIHQKYRTHLTLGTYYRYHTEYDKALTHFFKSLDYLPNHSNTYNQIAITLFCKNSFELADKYIQKAVRMDPESGEIRSTLSLILLKKGNADEAIKEGKKALRLNKKFTKARYMIGEAYRLKNQLKQSVNYFEQYFKEYPGQLGVNISLIELYFLLNNQDALHQRVFHLLDLAKEKKLSEILLDYNNEFNFLDYSRIKRIVHAIEKTVSQQSNDLSELLNKKPPEYKKEPSTFIEPDSLIF